jgi:quercetin dioxygenase-like cupin family protein
MVTENHQAIIQVINDKVTRRILSYSDQLMTCEMTFKKGGIGAPHTHVHEQISYVVSGAFEYEEAGVKRLVKRGDTFYVAPNVEHGVIALEDGILLDIFTPKRDDFLK